MTFDKKDFLAKGKVVEESFRELFEKTIKSSKSEDVMDHWDIGVCIKFDVKGMKKINRTDTEVNENYHYLEIKGITGHNGWLCGEADYFAFETQDYYIIVEKYKLQNWIKTKLSNEYSEYPALYKRYRRKDRLDLTTIVKSLDLCFLSTSIIQKQTK